MRNQNHIVIEAHRKSVHPYILSFLTLAAILMLSTLFGRDVFAIDSPIGRIVYADVLMIIFIILFIFSFRKISISSHSFLLFIALFSVGLSGIVSLIHMAFSGGIITAVGIMDSVRYVIYSLVVILTTQIIRTRRVWFYFLIFWLIILCAVIFIGIGQILAIRGVPVFESTFYWENIRGREERVASTFRWQGPLVFYFGISLPLLSSAIIYTKNRLVSAALFLVLCTGILVLFFSGSRTAMLVLPLSLAPFLFKYKLRQAGIGLVGFIIGGVTIFQVTQIQAVSRAVLLWQRAVTNPTSEPRFRIWYSGFISWRDVSPLFGVGPRQLVYYSEALAHNGYLGILFERGLVGFLFLTLFIFILIRISSYLLTNTQSEYYFINIGLAMGVGNMFLYMATANALTLRFTPVYLGIIAASYELMGGSDGITEFPFSPPIDPKEISDVESPNSINEE